MKIRLWIIWLFLVVFLSACAKTPFEKVDFRSVDHLDPISVCENFEKKLPDSFEVMESAVYIYKGLQLAVISYTRVNEKEDSIEIIGLNPLGLKPIISTDSSFSLTRVYEIAAI